MELARPNLFLTSTVILIVLCQGLPPNAKDKDVYRNLIDGKGLYDEKDKVVIVNATTLKSVIFGTENAWLLEFYNSWCGHCFMFAPKWKALAADIHSWGKVVKLAALDCSTEENNPTCREYDIMGYPTIKFFPAHAPGNSPGIEIQREDIGQGSPLEIERLIVGMLRKEQIEGRGSNWPNLVPLRASDLGHMQTDGAQHVFIVFEHADSPLGTQLILDMSSVDQVEVRTAHSENEALAKSLGVHLYPSVVYIPHSHGESEILHPADSTRESFRSAIRAYLTAKGVNLPEDVPQASASVEAGMPNLAELMRLHNEKAKIRAIKEKGDVVYLADMETALRYMLQHEIPVKRVIQKEALSALRAFLRVVAKYFPAGEAGIQYLQALRDAVEEGNEIRGIRFRSLVRETRGGISSVLTTEDGYIGCRGSEPHLRGYPCSVWTMFHYLTISGLRSQNPLEVVGAMHGYITYFFGCTECSIHFQDMAARSMRAKSTDAEQAALWLWSAHNEVNARLAGAETEDPEYRKIPYPAPEHCPKCRDSAGRWSEPQVLQYLRNKYHQDNLNYQGANTRVAVAQRPELPPSNRHLVETVEELEPKTSKYFNFLDLSICVALYGLSAAICGALFWKFVLRRHYRRKLF